MCRHVGHLRMTLGRLVGLVNARRSPASRSMRPVPPPMPWPGSRCCSRASRCGSYTRSSSTPSSRTSRCSSSGRAISTQRGCCTPRGRRSRGWGPTCCWHTRGVTRGSSSGCAPPRGRHAPPSRRSAIWSGRWRKRRRPDAQGLHERAAMAYDSGPSELVEEPDDPDGLELRDQLEASFISTASIVPDLQPTALARSTRVIENAVKGPRTQGQRLLLAQTALHATTTGESAHNAVELAERPARVLTGRAPPRPGPPARGTRGRAARRPDRRADRPLPRLLPVAHHRGPGGAADHSYRPAAGAPLPSARSASYFRKPS